MEEIKEFLQDQNEKIKELHKKLHFSYFDAIISGKEELYKEAESKVKEYSDSH